MKNIPVVDTSKSFSIYWQCQLIGWSLSGLWWAYQGWIDSVAKSYIQAGIHFVGDCLIGIVLTHSYRNLSIRRNWDKLTPQTLLPRLIASVFVLGTLFMILIAIKLYLVRLYFAGRFSGTFTEFFQTNWLILWVTGVRLMAVWVLAFHMYQYARYRIHMAEENARLAVLAKQVQLNNLSAQLNPHFFFNSLNNIKFLVIENPHAARRAIDILSDLLRTSLYRNGEELVSLKQEMNLVRDYLELEKLRFEERLHIQLDIGEEVLPSLIPPFSIQTLVENAIKHGIGTRKEGGSIAISLQRKESQIHICVESPGRLTFPSSVAGLGLKNLKERLQLQFNGKAAFDLINADSERVLATISIPAI